jgi:hypothetical protein
VARLDGAPDGEGVRAIRPVDLPTVAVAWGVFDAVEGMPAALAPDERRAVLDFQEQQGAVHLIPARWPPSPALHRAAAEAAAAAPALPGDVAAVLAILAVLLVALTGLSPARRRPAWVGALWRITPALAVFAWFVLGTSLPGAVRAHALVLEDEGARMVLLRLEAVRDGVVRVQAPPGAGVIVPVAWGEDDAPPAGTPVGAHVEIELPRGRRALLAYALPGAAPSRLAGEATSEAAAAVRAALRATGRTVRGRTADPDTGALRIEGARLVDVAGFALSGRD